MNEVLLDVTGWLLSFDSFARESMNSGGFPGLMSLFGGGGGGGRSETTVAEIQAFERNFLLRCMTQKSAGALKKSSGEATIFYTTAFCLLPEVPMVPRPCDRRVGYFTTMLDVGGVTDVTRSEYFINKWDLDRHGGQLVYCIDPAVPKVYHETIKRGVVSWNGAFRAAGLNGTWDLRHKVWLFVGRG